jgi:hypothetical protein
LESSIFLKGKNNIISQMVPENFGDGRSVNAILFISDERAFDQYENIFIANIVKEEHSTHNR